MGTVLIRNCPSSVQKDPRRMLKLIQNHMAKFHKWPDILMTKKKQNTVTRNELVYLFIPCDARLKQETTFPSMFISLQQKSVSVVDKTAKILKIKM